MTELNLDGTSKVPASEGCRLKTLKDLEIQQGKANGLPFETDTIIGIQNNILRQEAIKWVKELSFDEKCRTDDNGLLTELSINEKLNYFADGDGSFLGVIKWIQYVFNITDEELKDV